MDNWRGRGAFASWTDEMLADYAADGLLEAGEGQQRHQHEGAILQARMRQDQPVRRLRQHRGHGHASAEVDDEARRPARRLDPAPRRAARRRAS